MRATSNSSSSQSDDSSEDSRTGTVRKRRRKKHRRAGPSPRDPWLSWGHIESLLVAVTALLIALFVVASVTILRIENTLTRLNAREADYDGVRTFTSGRTLNR
jgi:hypothetical protein